MMKYKALLVTIVYLMLRQCRTVKSTGLYIPENSTATYMSGFCIDILKEEALLKPGNIISAPIAIHLVLLLMLFGTKGSTFQQLLHAIANDTTVNKYQYELSRDIKARSNFTSAHGVILEVDNEAFISHAKSIQRDFRNYWAPHFCFNVRELDFSKPGSAADYINARVNQGTHGRISKLISPGDITPRTAMILTSAIYFKGEWKKQFSLKNTVRQKFYLSRRKSIQVLMMSIKDKFRIGYCPVLEAKWLELPFKGDRYSMFVVIPKEMSGMNNLLFRMTGEHIQKMNFSEKKIRTVQVYLPKFNVSYEADLANTLQAFGLGELFTPAANFEGISPDIYISKFIHKAQVSVDEFGAKASAASSVTLATKSRGKTQFRVDRPFLIFIVDKFYRVPLFVGRVVNPAK